VFIFCKSGSIVEQLQDERRNMVHSVDKTTDIKQKTVIIGESHAMNCAAELQYSLDTIFAVSSFVKPGTGMSVIADTVEEEITKLESDDDDDAVVWGGSTDTGKNNSKEALRHFYIISLRKDRT